MTKHAAQLSICTVLALAALTPAGAPGQIREPGDIQPARGIAPTGVYRIEDMETVNPVSRKQMLSIPIAELPANRGGDPGFRLTLTYNAAIYQATSDYTNHDQFGAPELTHQLNMAGGWTYNLGYTLLAETRPGGTWPCPGSDELLKYFNRLTLVTPDGSRHLLRLSGKPDYNGDGYYEYDPSGAAATHCSAKSADLTTDADYYTTDGTFYNVRVSKAQCTALWGTCPWTLFFPDGSRLDQSTFAAGGFTLTSRTGNTTTVVKSGGPPWTTTITDNSNRAIVLVQAYSDFVETDTITIKGFTGTPIITTVNWEVIPLPARNYGCTASGYQSCRLEGSVPAVRGISLPQALCDNPSPNCLTYAFGYDTDNSGQGIGQLSSIRTPWGASTAYRYTMDSSASGTYGWTQYTDNALTTRTVSRASDEPYAWPDETTTYAWNASRTMTTVTAPDGAPTKYYYFTDYPAGANNKGGLVYRIDHPDGTAVERYWADNNPPGAPVNAVLLYNNPYVKTEFSTAAGLTSARDSVHDINGNLFSMAEYDWFNAASQPIPHSQDEYGSATGLPAGLTPVRTTLNTYYYPPGSYPYMSTASPIFRSAPASGEVRMGGSDGTVAARTEYSYRAVNATIPTSVKLWQEWRWDSIKSPVPPSPLSLASAVVTEYSYDTYGNLTSVIEPGRSNTDRTTNTYTYQPDAVVDGVAAPGTFLKTAVRAYGTAEAITSRYDRDPWTGLATSETPDTQNALTVARNYDLFGRLKSVDEGIRKSAVYEYSVQRRRIIRTVDLDATRKLYSVEHFDSRGRPWRRRTVESGGLAAAQDVSQGILVDTQHHLSAAGRCTVVSNPYKSGPAAPDAGWTLTNRDGMDRPTTVWHFAGSTAPVCGETGNSSLTSTGKAVTSYNNGGTVSSRSGVAVRVTDEDSKARLVYADGLGRTLGVNEDPSGSYFETTYDYDVLDDLKTVTQGSQRRTFHYDSLRRLTDSYQPEMNPNGTGATLAASYTYTNDGLVETRTDGNGVVTHYGYDGLNRPKTKWATGGLTPYVTWCYDGTVATGDGTCGAANPAIAFGHGRLTETRSNLAAEGVVSLTRISTYDAVGRVTASQQMTNGLPWYVFGYDYNGADGLAFVTYPSGRVVRTGYDDAGRPLSLVGTMGGIGTSYADAVNYAASGGMSSLTVTGKWVENRTYNSRMQLAGVSAGNLTVTLGYGGTNNNGNVRSQTVTRGGAGWTQSYDSYDGMNRLQSARETVGSTVVWSRSWDYDRYGNGWVSGWTGMAPEGYTAVGSANYDGGNHLKIQPVAYDNAGNQTVLGGYGRSYDADGRMESSTINGVRTVCVYDGDGRRVMRKEPGGSTTYVYDAMGQLAAEYGSAAAAAPVCELCWVTQDHLGSTRMVTNAATGQAVGCHDYQPFGEEITVGRSGDCWTAKDTTLRFTGKEREYLQDGTPAGLDYFGARYFSSAQGRFTSPDEPLIDQYPADPQSWNLYSYVRNNPLRSTDPTGEACVVDPDGSEHDDENPGQSCADAHKPEENNKPSATVGEESSPAPYTYEYYRQVARDLPTLLDRGNRPQVINDAVSIFGYDQNVPLPSCFGGFVRETLETLNPFSPSITTAVEAAGTIQSARYFNQALRYAASTPSRTFGTPFIVYPNKSSVFRSLLGKSGRAAGAGFWGAIVTAEGFSLWDEINASSRGVCQ